MSLFTDPNYNQNCENPYLLIYITIPTISIFVFDPQYNPIHVLWSTLQSLILSFLFSDSHYSPYYENHCFLIQITIPTMSILVFWSILQSLIWASLFSDHITIPTMSVLVFYSHYSFYYECPCLLIRNTIPTVSLLVFW